MIEIWKDIEGFEGCYQISSRARVRSVDRNFIDSLNRKCSVKGRVLKQCVDGRGAYKVNLKKQTKSKTVRIKKLMYNYFHEI